jgi:xanthine/CO dehydrogenase XdhC/CoxF family maturation factor
MLCGPVTARVSLRAFDQRQYRKPMSSRRILQAFDAWRGQAEPLVLATVYATIGSTYSKAGHRILIASSGDYQGLVSGGCLEGDLASRAQSVLAVRAPAAVTYDLRDEADELFGLGIGCNGLIRVFLQPLLAEHDHEPFASLARAMLGRPPAACATVIEAGTSGAALGATLIRAAGGDTSFLVDDDGLERRLDELCRAALATGSAALAVDADGLTVLAGPLRNIPRLLVLGAGLDAIPLVNLATELGWIVTVADHRPAYVERGGFGAAEAAIRIEADDLAHAVDLARFDAIVVMSHHLATDRAYLRQLATVDTPYVGVLGPPGRKARLLDELGADAGDLGARLRGPVGMDIGADTPESIALSILAEAQAVIAGHATASRPATGRVLRPRTS